MNSNLQKDIGLSNLEGRLKVIKDKTMQENINYSKKELICMISQPRYLPFLGYLRRIRLADVFVIYDNVQRVERGYENRNKLKSSKRDERQWLTIPVIGGSRCLIKDAKVPLGWEVEHKQKIREWYKADVNGASFIKRDEVPNILESYYKGVEGIESYSQVLTIMLQNVLTKFNVRTKIICSSELDYKQVGGIKDLVSICKSVGATNYISGKTCLEYGFTEEFAKENKLNLIIDDWKPAVYGNEDDYLAFIHFEMLLGKVLTENIIHDFR